MVSTKIIQNKYRARYVKLIMLETFILARHWCIYMPIPFMTCFALVLQSINAEIMACM